jgi:hypothetical protein
MIPVRRAGQSETSPNRSARQHEAAEEAPEGSLGFFAAAGDRQTAVRISHGLTDRASVPIRYVHPSGDHHRLLTISDNK